MRVVGVPVAAIIIIAYLATSLGDCQTAHIKRPLASTRSDASVQQPVVAAGPSLDETVSWLKSKVETFGGGVGTDIDSGWNYHGLHIGKRSISHFETNNVHVSYGPAPCELHVSWTMTGSTERIEKRDNSSVDDVLSQSAEVVIDIPLYEIKEASATDNHLSLNLDGKKAVHHTHGTKSRSWTGWKNQDDDFCHNARGDDALSCMASPSEKPERYGHFPIDFDNASANETIPFERDSKQDNDQLAQRAATAFNHLRDLCVPQKPKSNEPF